MKGRLSPAVSSRVPGRQSCAMPPAPLTHLTPLAARLRFCAFTDSKAGALRGFYPAQGSRTSAECWQAAWRPSISPLHGCTSSTRRARSPSQGASFGFLLVTCLRRRDCVHHIQPKFWTEGLLTWGLRGSKKSWPFSEGLQRYLAR